MTYDGKQYRSLWNPGEDFPNMTENSQKAFSAISALDLSSGDDRSHFATLSRKFKIPLYPSLVLKPFILVEELKWALESYQRKSLRIPDTSNAKLKTTRKRTLLFSPYYRRLYGLHIEWQW
ncbi:hypothetical protein CSB45_09460 [candidate division KSB3 bacterium]|uniref:Uncharacterized protein n=1 Tax=candidate division KSB3 bacterium TaxID=2044937 RepID=A0A2G6E4R3_9BACT|nr:MAG: hypothetical protein CSB45_09460 [candidate division KSB3 bacterium]PIE29449.1 MAG: hypothetical protein CSA57_08615 [candidate division KSB3 bacterium]